MDNIILAIEAAERWHRGQVRKYSGERYSVHPHRVRKRLPDGYGDAVYCAAELHDVMEDCFVTAGQIVDLFPTEPMFGLDVARLVVELTNPSKKHPELSRAKRKEMDRDHARGISAPAKWIKLADRTDNMLSIEPYDPTFAKLYAAESRLLFESLKGADLTKELETEYLKALTKLEQFAATAAPII